MKYLAFCTNMAIREKNGSFSHFLTKVKSCKNINIEWQILI